MFDSKGLADLLVSHSLGLRKGDLLVIYSSSEAYALVRELYEDALRGGAYPYLVLSDELLEELFASLSDDDTLSRLPRFLVGMQEEMTARASILSSTHTRHLAGVDPDRVSAMMRARRRLNDIFMDRQSRGELRWVVAPYPTRAMAQEAGMGPSEFESFVEGACMLDEPDPSAAWRALRGRQEGIAARLNSAKTIEIRGENANLRISVDGRRWINDAGERNMPGGEVFTGPVEESAEGWIRFTYPAVWRGIRAEGVELTFKGGLVVGARAERGEDKLMTVLGTDPGARRLGELAFGLNPRITRFTGMILFDEKIGGTMHLALGASYPDTGGRNASAIHWDMITDMRESKVLADGDLIYDGGEFLL